MGESPGKNAMNKYFSLLRHFALAISGLFVPTEVFTFDSKEYPENTIKENRTVQWDSRDKTNSRYAPRSI
jgi:hypothetical protein